MIPMSRFLANPPIVMSRRFWKAYRSSIFQLQGLIEGAIHDLINRIRSDRTTFLRSYDRVAHLKEVVQEVDVAGSRRMLVCWRNDTLHLLDVGGKEIVPRYVDANLRCDLHQRDDVPTHFWPDVPEAGPGFFTSNPCTAFAQFGNENETEWLYFLSAQQEDVYVEIGIKCIEDLRSGQQTKPVFIIGGPGTGKTCVLLNLLKFFHDHRIATEIRLSEDVANYIDACLPTIDIKRFECNERPKNDTRVVLVDDPMDALQIRTWLQPGKANGLKGVIVTFDPCQLSSYERREHHHGISDDEFDSLCDEFRVDVHPLNECYRQKENVGREAKKAMDTIADSTPYLDKSKIEKFHEKHSGLTEISNSLTFPNPNGYLEDYPDATIADLDKELNRICCMPLWKHWLPLLFVTDTALDIAVLEEWKQRVKNRLEFMTIPIDRVQRAKGLEFQHSFVLLGKQLFDELNVGFSGAGQDKYAKRRLMRIPFSRAKDSMVVFVVPD